MQVDFDGALSGAGMTGTDGAPKMPPLSEAQRFLDLTHPGHGLDVEQMRAADAEAVLGAAAFNFFTASRMSAPATTLSASLTKRLKSSLRQAAAARTSARLRSHPLTSA